MMQRSHSRPMLSGSMLSGPVLSGHCRRLIAALLLVLPASAALALSPLTGVQQLALGDSHACVLLGGGAVHCWGNNEYGQLGNDTTVNSNLPVPVSGLSSGVIAIGAGYRHSCALLAGGTVKCWGKNILNALGDGTNVFTRRTPVDVVGVSGATAIAIGDEHGCAQIGTSAVKCWGYNRYGQIGNGNDVNQNTAVNVIGGQNLRAVSAGSVHTCALSNTNTVRCWGVRDRICNTFGCAFDYVVSPQNVPLLGNDVASISAGQYYNCALTNGGAVKCWGDNYEGVLGDLSGIVDDPLNPDPLTPYAIVGLGSGVSMVSAGYRHACARLSGGGLRCWGSNGGKLGNGASANSLTPVPVSGLSATASVHAGGSFSCARMANGGVQCWGGNASGQLGDGEPWVRSTPVDVPALGSGVRSISAGETHTCAVTASGAVKCWGDNARGQLGDGSLIERTVPADVAQLGAGALSVSAGMTHSCAVAAGGAVKCWGGNDYGQIGNGSFVDQPTPVDVSGLASGISVVSAGSWHSCARLSSGAARCWGMGLDGQIGDGFLQTRPTPATVANLANGATTISAGNRHSCAAVNGRIACWGDNSEGQLGVGNYEDSRFPVEPGWPNQGTTAISAGDRHSCAVASGAAWCWGSNSYGQIGIGFSSGSVYIPAEVQGLSSGVSAISAGLWHSCAVGPGGKALCWGSNVLGQLGNGAITASTAPAEVSGLGSGIAAISAGAFHSCALSVGGMVKCWGDNSRGQLGIGRRNYRLPAPVLYDPALFRDGFEGP